MKNGFPHLNVWSLGWISAPLVLPLFLVVSASGCGDAKIVPAAYAASPQSNSKESASDKRAQQQGEHPEDPRAEAQAEENDRAKDTKAKKRTADDKQAADAKARRAKDKQGDTTVDDNNGDDIEADKKLVLTKREWRKRLTRQQYHVLREKGTERPFTNEYDHHFEPGAYACAGCGQILFASETKFNSGCGWPAFYAAEAGDRVKLTPDYTYGMVRTEVTCSKCDGHLGHIFDDAPQTPTGQRYCINSVALKFIPAEELAVKEKAAKEEEPKAKPAEAESEE